METTRKMTKALLWGVLVLLFTFIPLSHAVAQTCVQPPSGLIGWWDADSVSGTTATDISGNGNDGTIVGGVSIVPGFVGNAFSFNGTSRISGVLSNFTPGNSPITIAAWFNQPTASGHPGMGIVGVGDVPNRQHFFQRLCTDCSPSFIWDGVDGKNRLFIGADDGSSDRWWASNTVITQNEWNFGVTTWDPFTKEVRIYINGALARTQILSTGLSLTNRFFTGGDAYNDNFFNGLIDETQIFNRVLTDTEILAEFLAGNAGKCKPFVLSCPGSDPITLIDEAITEIDALEAALKLDFDTAQTLVETLDEVRDDFSLGDLEEARSEVSTFVEEIEDAVDEGSLTTEDANVLLTKAACILATIEFPNE